MSSQLKVKIVRIRDGVSLPRYQTPGSAAMDLEAAIQETIVLQPMERIVIPSGFAMELPDGYEAQIRPRSGLSLKQGIALANGIATIDSDYRGEVGIILINLSGEPQAIEPHMRVAQMVVAPYSHVSWLQTDELHDTIRGSKGYGSTGKIDK